MRLNDGVLAVSLSLWCCLGGGASFFNIRLPCFIGRARVARQAGHPLWDSTSGGSMPRLDNGGVNVCLTHAVCDFDSLAAAVGLAKLWAHQYPHRPSVVVLPQGAHPTVESFLALHSILFPIRPLSLIDPTQVNMLGIVDASTLDRLGQGQKLVAAAREVFVFDHHVMKQPDINATELVVDNVGSVTTLITEKLREAGISLTDAEATLMAIGIHADTGSLTFDSATTRDCWALAWLMGLGARQAVISEYCKQRLTPEQQQFLSESFQLLNTTTHHGVNIGTVVVDCREYVGGLSRVAQHVLELTSSDVVVWGGRYIQGSGAKQTRRLVLIGRARSSAEWVNFEAIWSKFGGGGHCKAAAANVRFDKLDDPDKSETHILELVVEALKQQIDSRRTFQCARDIMVSPVLTCTKETSMAEVGSLLRRFNIHGMPVMTTSQEGGTEAVGMVTHLEVLKAFKAGKMESPVAGWFLKKLQRVRVDTPLDEVKTVMVGHEGRDLLVIGEDGRSLVGIISKSDVLRSFSSYDPSSYIGPEKMFV